MHAIDNRLGLAVLVGEVGTGKTTVSRHLLESLDEEEYHASLLVVIHSDVSPIWMLRKIAQQLGLSAEEEEEKGPLVEMIGKRLFELYDQNRKAIILVDEANMLRSPAVLEEFRGLLNLETSDAKLVTFVLIGLPDLDQWLEQDKPLKQRTAVRFTLHALNPAVTKSYVVHRLAVAGREEPLFTEEAYKEVYKRSEGIPRLINTLCDNALLEGALVKSQQLDAKLVEDVAIGLGL